MNQSHLLSLTLISCLLFSCKKSSKVEEVIPKPGGGTTTETPVVKPVDDPTTANTMGFFLNDWKAKTFTAPAFVETASPTIATNNVVTVDASSVTTKIPLSMFGHNANTWMTPMYDQPIFMANITNLHPHIIRFPAGSGSDAYFWNQLQDVNPSDAPTKIMDKDGVLKQPGYGYGKTTNNWQASLDNYYAMLQQSGNRGMITVNYGYARYGTSADPVAAAAHLAADWVRYDNGRTEYWEVGNENYGDWEWGYRIDPSKNKDGQPEILTGKLYAQHFKVFADSMKKAAAEINKTIYIGATTYESATEAWQTNTVKTWNSGMMPDLNGKHDFYIVHNYITPYGENSNAGTVLGAALSVPTTMMTYVSNQIKTYGGADKPIALTEWNMWASGSKQQVSNTSGLFAVLVLGEAIKNKYAMAARWDLLNGWSNGDDHGLFSDGGEPGIPKWTPRPSFYYMYFFQKMLGDRLVPTTVAGSSSLKAYASTYSSGQANVTLVNTSSTPITTEIKTKNFNVGSRFYWYSLEGSNDNGEFSRKVIINGSGPSIAAGGPIDYATLKARSSATTGVVKVIVPGFGAVCVVMDKK
ncbi:MAG: alpha-L-arabinofuranosidase-like protein [Daejeonella sp.]|nr:alpha-L-arabinofuranosidase-like protein [Daejeonella sp.]